jgi:hypothetical protein
MLQTTIDMLTNFGAAGLIGVLWLAERRQSTKRDRQLDEAHQRLIEHRRDLNLWLRIVRDNTRALGLLEQAQRELTATLQRWRRGGRSEND